MLSVDEASVRSALTEGDGAPLAADEIASVVIEGEWLGVAIAREDATNDLLSAVYERLRTAFPDVSAEVHAGTQVFRGGAGFGEGRYVVAVLGGKGGVGKSTITVNLALTLSAMGVSVGILDGDLNAPDIPHMLGISLKEAKRAGLRMMTSGITPPSQRREPQERFGLEVMSVGFLVSERLPPMTTSRLLVSTLLRSFVFEAAWGADVLLIDAPPGTGEELQVIAGELPLSGALFVTTPQDLAQMDAERTLTLLTDHDVPVIGVVQNMASMTCPHCDEEIDMFARSARMEDAGVPIVGRIPFDVALSVRADRGLPLVLGDPRGPIALEFARIGNAARRWLAGRGGRQ